MNKKILKFLTLSIILFSGIAFANPWSGTTEVTTLYPYTNGLIFNTNYKNSEISTCDNGSRFSIDKSHANYETLVSAMLAAFMSGKKINFKINDDQQPSCQPTINRFAMSK